MNAIQQARDQEQSHWDNEVECGKRPHLFWFTVFAEGPQKDRWIFKTETNCAGQLVLFDGKATTENMRKFVGRARECFDAVTVFRGQRIGRLIDL